MNPVKLHDPFPLRQKSNAYGHRGVIGDGSTELFEISSRCHQLLNTSLCNQNSKHSTWTGVGTSTEGKQMSVQPQHIETLRVRIERWITICGCQNDKDIVTFLHGVTGNTT